jgi:protein O-mannosyl-transferase
MSLKIRVRILLVCAVLVVFGRCLGNDFVDWDDSRLIYLNDDISHPTASHLADPWWPYSPRNSHMYDPLVYTTWWMLANVAQVDTPDVLGATLNPIIFHAANLVVHCAVVCLVFEILLTLGLSTWPAAAGALIFAIHPLQTESVVWATAMKDLLTGLFSMLCIWRYLVASQSEGRKQRREYWIATICFIAALLSKPSAVVLPAIVGAIDLIFLQTPWRRVAIWTAPWLLVSAGAIWLARSVQLNSIEHIQPLAIQIRPLIALDSLAFYLYKLFIPIQLSIDYGRSPSAILHDPSYCHPLYWTWIFPVVAGLLIWRSKRRDLIAASLIFLFGVLPVLGLTTFVYQYWSTVADRYVYVSMLGVAWAVGLLLTRYQGRIAITVFSIVAVVLGSLSIVQAGIWSNTGTLMANAVKLNHTRGLHYVFYGQYEDKLAAASFRQAALAAHNGDAAGAEELVKEGKGYLERAVEIYNEGKGLDFLNPKFMDSLAFDYIQLGRIDDAIATVREWIEMQPRYEEGSREKPGRLQDMVGSLYLRKGDYKDAAIWFEEAEKIQPDPLTEQHLEYARKELEAARSSTAPSSMP